MIFVASSLFSSDMGYPPMGQEPQYEEPRAYLGGMSYPDNYFSSNQDAGTLKYSDSRSDENNPRMFAHGATALEYTNQLDGFLNPNDPSEMMQHDFGGLSIQGKKYHLILPPQPSKNI